MSLKYRLNLVWIGLEPILRSIVLAFFHNSRLLLSRLGYYFKNCLNQHQGLRRVRTVSYLIRTAQFAKYHQRNHTTSSEFCRTLECFCHCLLWMGKLTRYCSSWRAASPSRHCRPLWSTCLCSRWAMHAEAHLTLGSWPSRIKAGHRQLCEERPGSQKCCLSLKSSVWPCLRRRQQPQWRLSYASRRCRGTKDT